MSWWLLRGIPIMGHFKGPVPKSSINSSLKFRDNKYQHDINIPIFKLVWSILTPQKFTIQISTSPSPTRGHLMSFHLYFLTFENSKWERMIQRPVFTWSIHQVGNLILHFIQGQVQIILAFGEDGLDLSELAESPPPKKWLQATRKTKAISGKQKGRLPYFIQKKGSKTMYMCICVYVYITSPSINSWDFHNIHLW